MHEFAAKTIRTNAKEDAFPVNTESGNTQSHCERRSSPFGK